MRNILFLESGTSGGGSFESLYQILNKIDRSRYKPVVGYLNKTHHLERTKSLGVSTYLLTDFGLSRHANSIVQMPARGARHLVRKWVPSLNLEFTSIIHGRVIRAIEHIIRKEKIQIMHLNDCIYRDMFGVLVAKRMGIPCISHLRSKEGGYLDGRSAAQANQVVFTYIAISRFIRDYWVSKGLETSKITVMHNAVDTCDQSSLDIKREFGLPHGVRIVACVGRLVAWKGHEFLIKAFARVVRNDRSAVLILIGAGPEQKRLQKLSAELGLSDAVIFAGYRKEAARYMRSFDVLVVPSYEEPFGRVLLEGMKAATPIVATSSGGIPEILQDNVNGLLVNYGDIAALSKAIVGLLREQDLRRRLVQNGQNTLKRFGMEQYVRILEGIYERCWEERRAIV